MTLELFSTTWNEISPFSAQHHKQDSMDLPGKECTWKTCLEITKSKSTWVLRNGRKKWRFCGFWIFFEKVLMELLVSWEGISIQWINIGWLEDLWAFRWKVSFLKKKRRSFKISEKSMGDSNSNIANTSHINKTTVINSPLTCLLNPNKNPSKVNAKKNYQFAISNSIIQFPFSSQAVV
jgi:hypothetical protein